MLREILQMSFGPLVGRFVRRSDRSISLAAGGGAVRAARPQVGTSARLDLMELER